LKNKEESFLQTVYSFIYSSAMSMVPPLKDGYPVQSLDLRVSYEL